MRAGRNIWKAVLACAGAALLSGCTLSAALRQDEIRSVWGPGRALQPPTVHFITDRQREGESFGLGWGGTAHCGRATVRIANAVSAAAPDPALTHIACEGSGQMAQFTAELARATRAQGCDRVLIVVHGFNLTFRTGLLHGAQIAMDTQWRCATLLVNWASEGMFNRYAADIERSGYAVPLLIEVLRGLAAEGIRAELLGHSMGARIALGAVAALCAAPTPIAGELILVAPDVSAEAGNDDFARLLARDMACARRATVYASDYDLALMASESFHGGVPRAGQQPLRNLEYQKAMTRVDAVDATFGPGDPSGHAYFVFAYEALSDLMWVLDGATVAERVAKGTLTCVGSQAADCAGGRAMLKVEDSRQPSLWRRAVRAVWPLILPFQ